MQREEVKDVTYWVTQLFRAGTRVVFTQVAIQVCVVCWAGDAGSPLDVCVHETGQWEGFRGHF